MVVYFKVNQEYIRGVDSTLSPPLTTCIPLAGAAASVGSSHNGISGSQNARNIGADKSLVRLEQASAHVYQQAMYITVGIGGMLLAVILKIRNIHMLRDITSFRLLKYFWILI